MLEKLLHLYTTAMTHDVRSPMPHLVGPPGTGKSTIVQQAADLLGVHLHIINVNRLSPLEIEGLQMPVDNNTRIHMIPAVFWSRLAEGDIVLFDEYLRGFPEVQDALLDVLTSRRVGAFQLPKVFFVGASNSVIAYDKALEDRLLNIPVQDLRSSAKFLKAAKARFIEEAGLHPDLIFSYELRELFDQEVLPTYAMLDAFKDNKTMAVADLKGSSVRNLVGQVNRLGPRIDPVVLYLDQPSRIGIRIDQIDGFGAAKSAIELVSVVQPPVVLARQRPCRKREGQPIFLDHALNHGHGDPPPPGNGLTGAALRPAKRES